MGYFRGETARYGCLLLAALAAAVSGPIIAKALTERHHRQALEAAGFHVGTKRQYGGLVQVVASIHSGAGHMVCDTDAHLIGRASGIENIYIQESGLTDESLDRIGRLPSLQKFNLWRGRITDEGVRRFRPGNGETLRLINLNLPQLSDDALANLITNNRRLNHVSLSGTGAGRRALSAAAKLPQLVFLDMEDVPLTNDDLRRLPSHPHLVVLDLRGTRLASPLPFDPQKFPSLRRLILNGTAVSREQADEWEAALPGLRVFVGER